MSGPVPPRRRNVRAFRHRLTASALLCAGAVVYTATDAYAGDVFRYVDRDGHVHTLRLPGDGEHAPEVTATVMSPAMVRARELSEVVRFSYSEPVAEAAALYNLPVELIFAVMKVESAFNPFAVSTSGAMGLMQLMPPTAAELGVLNAFEPRQNILGGAHYLRILLDDFNGDLTVALAAYHAGSRAIRKNGGVGPTPETRRYVVDVLQYYRMYRGADAATVLRVSSARREAP